MHLPVRRFAFLVATAALASGLAACSGSDPTPAVDHGASGMTGMSHSSATTPASATADEGRAADVMFAQMMIPHHQQAVEMADVALGKETASPQVRELATGIKAGQDPEIEAMKGWLTKWGAPLPTTGGSHEGMAGTSGQGMMTQADMDALKSAEGTSFDSRWVTLMIAHHEGAITMARQVLATTQNPEVTALAEAVVAAQTREIANMKGLS